MLRITALIVRSPVKKKQLKKLTYGTSSPLVRIHFVQFIFRHFPEPLQSKPSQFVFTIFHLGKFAKFIHLIFEHGIQIRPL